jgi:rRNA maturation protein Rpf1
MSLPQKKAMNHMIKRVFKTGRGILRELGDGSSQLPKTIAQKMSHHLGNINLLGKVEKFADRRIWEYFPEGGVIAYDLTDIAKRSAKKIENITDTFDGSIRKKSRGFFVQGVGFGQYLWRLRLHDNTSEFLPQIRKQILEQLIAFTKSKNPIFAFDRGNDSKDLFEYMEQKKARYIVRLKKDRKVILKETGEIVRVDELPEGRYEVLLTTRKTEQHKKPEYQEYQLVIYKKQKSKKNPIRLIFSKRLDPDKQLSNKKVTNLYLHRWGVENSFKQIKTALKREEIRVMKFKKFQNFVSLLHFCSLLNELLLSQIQENIKTFQNLSLTKIFYEYKKFLKRYTLTINSRSFFRFLQKIFPTFYVYRKRRNIYSQPSLFQFLHEKPKTF